MECFNRTRDSSKIKTQVINWEGPYAFPKFEKLNILPALPECSGVYLFTCDYLGDLVLYGLGITKQLFKKRISQHGYAYNSGKYNVLDMKALKEGIRKEIWHGWKYARSHQDEYHSRKEEISIATEMQLQNTKIYIANIEEKRIQERIEGAIAFQLYASKAAYADIIDKGMNLKGRYNSEIPINIINNVDQKIFGLPRELEI